MKIYEVGGCVRDRLLDIQPQDIDKVVVGSDPQKMKSLGFLQVSLSFPVFIHPVTGEEYALARSETKLDNSISSHSNFTTKTTDVSLEEDTLRRDLTINSIAYDPQENQYLDFHGGIKDLKNKTFRHTSSAFQEDPVRVLRLARFCARYGNRQYPFGHNNPPSHGFIIHKSTVEMCRQMDCINLQVDRVRKELISALSEPYPSHFFRALHQLGQLESIFPIIHKMINTIENPRHHAEGSSQDTRVGVVRYKPEIKK